MKEIKITEKAHKQSKRLFSSRHTVNTLKSDPELTAIFDNFAFDETLEAADGLVEEKTRVMCILASCMGCNALTEFRMYVDAALNVGVKPREIREIVYQAVPFLGFSRVLCFLLAMNEVFDDNDIRLPLDDQATTTDETSHAEGGKMIDALWGCGEHVGNLSEGTGTHREIHAGLLLRQVLHPQRNRPATPRAHHLLHDCRIGRLRRTSAPACHRLQEHQDIEGGDGGGRDCHAPLDWIPSLAHRIECDQRCLQRAADVILPPFL